MWYIIDDIFLSFCDCCFHTLWESYTDVDDDDDDIDNNDNDDECKWFFNPWSVVYCFCELNSRNRDRRCEHNEEIGTRREDCVKKKVTKNKNKYLNFIGIIIVRIVCFHFVYLQKKGHQQQQQQRQQHIMYIFRQFFLLSFLFLIFIEVFAKFSSDFLMDNRVCARAYIQYTSLYFI